MTADPAPRLGSALPAAEPTRGWLLAELDRLLDGAAVTRLDAGGFGWADAAGGVDPDKGRPLWITARMTHAFAVGTLLGRAQDAELAEHGLQALETNFLDPDFGGWVAQLDQDGRPAPTGKGGYDHAFVVLAGASASLAGLPAAPALLDRALAIQEAHFWDDEAGAVVEAWDRTWSSCEPYRGANANMHSVEAYLAAADATGDRRWRQRALRIAARIVDDGARAHGWRVPEHFDEQWRLLPDYNAAEPAHPFRPYGVTPGHGLEWARLLLHLEAALIRAHEPAPSWLRPAARGLFDRAMADGWDDEHGGICYTTDWNGRPVVSEHFHWVICEGIAAAVALHRVTGEAGYADWYQRLWRYARERLIDPAILGWQPEVDPQGRPSTRTWTGRPDIYHAVQALLMPFVPLAPVFAAALGELRPAGGSASGSDE